MGKRNMFGKVPVLALVVALFCACDRAPDGPQGESSSATHRETLHQIADLGAYEHRGESFLYELRGNCELDVRRLLNGAMAARFMLPLKDIQFERYDYSPGLGYAVRSIGNTANSSIVIFQAPQIEKIQRMLSLLLDLKTECVGNSAT